MLGSIHPVSTQFTWEGVKAGNQIAVQNQTTTWKSVSRVINVWRESKQPQDYTYINVILAWFKKLTLLMNPSMKRSYNWSVSKGRVASDPTSAWQPLHFQQSAWRSKLSPPNWNHLNTTTLQRLHMRYEVSNTIKVKVTGFPSSWRRLSLSREDQVDVQHVRSAELRACIFRMEPLGVVCWIHLHGSVLLCLSLVAINDSSAIHCKVSL